MPKLFPIALRTFSGYICSNVTTTRRRQEENHTKKMYYNCNECPQLVLKGVITQCALLEIGKKGDFFLPQKSLFRLKFGVFFSPKSVKRGIFSVQGTSMVTIKQNESDVWGPPASVMEA